MKTSWKQTGMSTHKGISDPPLPDISWEDAKQKDQKKPHKMIYTVQSINDLDYMTLVVPS